MMKLRKKIILGIAIFLFVLLGTTICILNLSQFHLDLSQDYRSVEGYEDIVFKDPKSKQCFRLCAWGLIKSESPDEFEDHRDPDTSSSEYQLCQISGWIIFIHCGGSPFIPLCYGILH